MKFIYKFAMAKGCRKIAMYGEPVRVTLKWNAGDDFGGQFETELPGAGLMRVINILITMAEGHPFGCHPLARWEC